MRPLSAASMLAFLISALVGALLVGPRIVNAIPLTTGPPPIVTIQLPESKVYTADSVQLAFTVDGDEGFGTEMHAPYSFGYSLDNQEWRSFWPSKITGGGYHYSCSTTLSGLPEGYHSLRVNVQISYLCWLGDVSAAGVSNTVSFTINAFPPKISVASPEPKTYNTTSVPLKFSVTETFSWSGYSLDGKTNVTLTGNTTLTGLPEGEHTLVVYATDTAGTTGASETIQFNILTEGTQPKLQVSPFSPALIATVFVSIAALSAGLLFFYFWKRNH